VTKTAGRHRRRWLIAGGIIIILLVWGAYLGARAVSAYHHDQKGLAALEQVKSNLGPNDLTSSGSIKLLDQAQAEFASASSELSSPLFAPVTILPVIGRQLRSARALSTAAGTVCSVGSTFLSRVHSVLNGQHGAGTERVASLRQLAAITASSGAQLAAVNTGPSAGLISPLRSKRNEFVAQLNDAQDRLVKASAVTGVVARILAGPETYVVLASNNAEMRAGSGAFLEVGAATTSDGSIILANFTPAGDVAVPAVAVTGDQERNWGWLYPSRDFRNLGETPQFNVTAPLAAQMWTAATGQAVDGVLSLDVTGVRQLMTATGPVVVNGQTIDADGVEQYLLHDQYNGVSTTAAQPAGRQDALGTLAGAVLRQLQGQTTDLKSLATAVSGAVAGRNLMVWSKNPVAQAAWVASGVSGSLTPRSVDVSVLNIAGNKLDQYLDLHVAVSTEPSGVNTQVTLTTKMSNTTPAGQSQYIAGPFPGSPLAYGEYYGVLAANVPGTATGVSISGAGPTAVKGSEGPTWVIGAPFNLLAGAEQTVTVHFTMPGSHGSMALIPSTRVPAEQWTANGRTFDDTTPVTITW
jgi:hypothetical protein